MKYDEGIVCCEHMTKQKSGGDITKKFALAEVKKARRTSSLWILLLEPIASRLSWVFVNYTNIRPNVITIISIFIAYISLFLVLWNYLILAAIIFELHYIFDMVDGRIGRLKNLTSDFGKCLDHFGDRIIYFSLAAALVFISYNKPNFIWIMLLQRIITSN